MVPWIYPTGWTERIPVRPLIAADMQAIKSLMGMTLGTHSVWCWCKPDTQHMTPIREYDTWADIEAWYERAGCKLKTLKDCCMLAHYSYGVLLGKRFTPVHCKLCGYRQSNESAWRKEIADFEQLVSTENVRNSARSITRPECLRRIRKSIGTCTNGFFSRRLFILTCCTQVVIFST